MRKMNRNAWLALLMLLASCADAAPQPTATPESTPTPTNTPAPTATLPTPATTAEATLFANRRAYEDQRLALVEYTILARDVDDPDVIRAMQTVPRHMFVPEDYKPYAYMDFALPIGYGQSISQPYIVALMTQLLDLSPGDKVLEIGTGSGYQAAVLAEIGQLEIYSIEIVPQLAAQAEENLVNAGYENVNLIAGDGYYGWEVHAPFDAIIVTAAPDHLPQPLVEQLKDGGIMVIPIGPPGWYQTLWRITKVEGELAMENIMMCGFVPFTGEGISSPKP
jgi:protein-L-isoaspartate(D-aspartate) O-methyltransferase